MRETPSEHHDGTSADPKRSDSMRAESHRTQNASSIQQVLPYGAVNSRRSSESSYARQRHDADLARKAASRPDPQAGARRSQERPSGRPAVDAMSRRPAQERFQFRINRLWTQREAAAYLQASERYLRASSCPKKLLPGTGVRGKPLVRYDPAEVQGWVRDQTATRRFA